MGRNLFFGGVLIIDCMDGPARRAQANGATIDAIVDVGWHTLIIHVANIVEGSVVFLLRQIPA